MKEDCTCHGVLNYLCVSDRVQVAPVTVKLSIERHGKEEKETILCSIGCDLFLNAKGEQDRIAAYLQDGEWERGEEAEDTSAL